MKVDLGIWAKLTRITMVLLFFAGVMAVFVWYLPLIRQNERMRKEILRLEALVEKEGRRNKELETAIHALRTDPKAVERLAREKLGYARPGETVIIFEEPATFKGN